MIANTNNLQSMLLNENLMPLLEPAGWMLVHSLWQLALIATLFFVTRAVVRIVAPKKNATLIYGIGCFCLAAMLLIPTATFAFYFNHRGTEILGSQNLDFAATAASVEEISQLAATLETMQFAATDNTACLLYTSPSPRDATLSRMPSSA